MTEERFLTILSAADMFKWQRTGTGNVVRAKLLTHTLRKDNAIIEWWTPITAVCYAYTAQRFHPADEREAAKVLDLDLDFTQSIIHQSDFPLSKGGAK